MANWLTNLFKPKEKQTKKQYAVTMTGYERGFSSYGKEILSDNLILSAIRLKQRFFCKLQPRHVRNVSGRNELITDSDVARLLRKPNPFQSTCDFLAQALFMRERDDQAYLYAYYDEKTNKPIELYVLLPNSKPQLYDNDDGTFELGFRFDGQADEVIFPLESIAIWRKDIEDSTFFGGGTYNNRVKGELGLTIDAKRTITRSIKEIAEQGGQFDGILKVNAFTGGQEKAQAVRDKFIEDLRKGKHGLAVLDNGSEYQDVKRNLQVIDANTQKLINDELLIYTGVSVEMLKGDFTTIQKNAFLENVIEPMAISLEQCLTNYFFSDWQQSHGDKILIYYNKAQTMSIQEWAPIIQSYINAGVLKIDELRDMIGFEPLPNGEGGLRPRGFNELDGQPTNDGKEVTE